MKTQAILSSLSMAAAAATAFIAVAGSPAHAAYGDFGADRCTIWFQGEPTGGMLSANVAPGYSGTYRLLVQSATPGNEVLANLSGSFVGNPVGQTQLVATFVSTTYVNEAGTPINGRPGAPRTTHSEIRDGVYGDDARLVIELEVYDTSGRLVCRQSDYRYERVSLPPFARAAMARSRAGAEDRRRRY